MKNSDIAGVTGFGNLSKIIAKKFHKSNDDRLVRVVESGTFFNESGAKWAHYCDLITQEEL